MENEKKIAVMLPNGLHLVVEQSTDPVYPYELYVGLEDSSGVWLQTVSVIRNHYCYTSDGDGPKWSDDTVDLMVYENPYVEDYTEHFEIEMACREEAPA